MPDETGTMPPVDMDYDGMSYFGGGKNQGITFKDIVLRAIEKCREEWGKELTRGGESSVFSSELNSWLPVSIPDQRKVDQQVTLALKDLLLYYFDETAKTQMKRIEQAIKDAPNKFYELYLQKEYWQPYKEAAAVSKLIQTGDNSNVGHFINQQFEDYIFECYRIMYQELILLFKRKNELSTKRSVRD